MLPFESLSAVSAVETGATRDFEGAVRTLTMLVTTTGTPTDLRVALEGSHDGTTWASLVQIQSASAAAFATANTHLVRYVRANLTVLSGGSSPTVTATILADVPEEE